MSAWRGREEGITGPTVIERGDGNRWNIICIAYIESFGAQPVVGSECVVAVMRNYARKKNFAYVHQQSKFVVCFDKGFFKDKGNLDLDD